MGRRAKGSGSLRKVTKERNGKSYTWWEAQVTIGVDPGTGKQKRRTFTGATQKEVREKMQAAAVTVNEGNYFEPSKMTVKEWFEIWLSEYCNNCKPLTVQKYKSMTSAHILPAIGAVKLSKLTVPQVQTFYNNLSKSGKTVTQKDRKTGKVEIRFEPLSAKTIHDIHGIISKALNCAVNAGMIKNNVAERVTLPKIIKREIQPLTETQQKAFLEAVANHEYKNLFLLILFTGLRESEAIGLTWDCIDFQNRTLKVCKQLQRVPGNWKEYRFTTLKNNKSRTITLSPFVLNILQQQHNKKMQQQIINIDYLDGWNMESERQSELVFTTETGNHIETPALYSAFKKIAAQIGIPEARIHDLRHTFAVISLQNGDDFKTVQDALGHATAAFTLDVYGHVSERMKEDRANRQQAYINRLIG